MRYRLPSFTALRALEAAGRRGSLSAAAKELGVSVGAISRHVTLLEEHFGRTLLRRGPSGVEPTPGCAAYLESISRAFDEIDMASHALASDRQRDNTLRLRFYSTFTTEWLSARLARFRELHPEIDLEFSLSIKDAEWRNDDFDMALTGVPPIGESFRCDRLFETCFALVCAPELAEQGRRAGHAWLSDQTFLMAEREGEFWTAVLRALGVPDASTLRNIGFDSLSMTYQAARQGAGIALGNLFFVAGDLQSGRLALPIDRIFSISLPHYIVTRRGRPDGPALRTFRSWLLQETAKAATELEEILIANDLAVETLSGVTEVLATGR
ncbi:MAG: LysR family transcriptional regulator [Betaproteobacteria bacterium]|nr:LysR family transcriptional regulator [Betaproteobacteria bacterium]